MYQFFWSQVLVVAYTYHPFAYAYDSIAARQPGSLALGSIAEPSAFEPQRREEDRIFYNFVTRPDIGAPRWHVQVYDEEALSPGYWFVAPYANLDQNTFPKWNGPHIYDSNGELVWSGAPLFNHWNTFDFRIVKSGGKDMLSLIFPHERNAEGVILDSNYEIHKALDLRGELEESNMHDFTVVDDGINALTLSNVKGPATEEQSKVIGFDGECHVGWEGFKELRVEDNDVVFEWSAKDWIGLDECTFIPGPPEERCTRYWDILHLNSIDKFDDGDYLISSRHMDTIYKISHVDGHIVWRLGGKKSDFDLQGEAVFSRQHHARFRGQNDTHTLISLFDNAHGDGPEQAEHPTNTISRGLLLALRADTKTAELIAHFDHPRGGISNSRGSLQFLPNGNIFMGWTYSSRQSEHTPDGRLLMEASFREGQAHSYRNYKFPWTGRPSKPPDVHSAAFNNEASDHVNTVVHVSWNGATEVKSWRLSKSTADGKRTRVVASTQKQGFETAIIITGYASFVIVEALGSRGELIGRSAVVKTIEPSNVDSPDLTAEMQWLQEESGSSTALEALWQRLPSIFRNPITIFAFGFACSSVIFCSVMGCRSRSSPSWWNRRTPLYARLSGRLPVYDQMSERCQEEAEQFELGSSDKYDEEEEMDETSEPLVRWRGVGAA